MRVHVVDPSAYTPPYDRALCAALADAGADVQLITSRFVYGPVPQARGYTVRECFYGLSRRIGARSASAGTTGRGLAARGRFAVKLAEHVPEMLRYRRIARAADVVHLQWLTVQPVDLHLLPRRPLVLTAHDVMPREPRPGQLRAQRRLYERVDAVIVHSEHGRRRLVEDLGLDSSRVHTIAHGAFTHLPELERTEPLPEPLAQVRVPVVLCFGLMRPYKGIDVLLEAWRGIQGAELWVVGMPRMDIEPLRAAAPPNVRFVPRFITEPEIPAYFRRADLVVLPYREIDQSGVLFTALAFGRPMILSNVGGFPDIARAGAARLVAPGDAGELNAALQELLADEGARDRLAAGARASAAEEYSWPAIARRTLALYRTLGSDHTVPSAARPGRGPAAR